MDLQFAATPPSKFMRILFQMNGQQPPRIDLFFVTGFADTLRFIELQNARRPGTHALDPAEVARVTWAWGDFEADCWSGGFVVDLRDGRRAYLESEAADREWGQGSRAKVVGMPPDLVRPVLSKTHGSELYGWTDEVSEIQEFLDRLAAADRAA